MERRMPMNRYRAIGLVAMLVVVVALPIYAYWEQGRMAEAQADLRQQFLVDGADLYVENCAGCHGPVGEGVGAMPSLNNPSLSSADRQVMYAIIAHSPHGTVMAAWHVDEGGRLNGYEVESLVTLIMNNDWLRVGELAEVKGFLLPTPSAPDVELATMEGTGQDPHECSACHEEPAVHAGSFGLNCSRCHTLQAWKPALLTRHTFLLDHGDEGKLTCQICHTQTYAEHTCYGCHDHEPEQMQVVHVEEELPEFEDCVECHPTGREGEAASLGYGRSGRESSGEAGDGQEIGQAQGGEPASDGGSPQGRGEGHGGGQ